MSRRCSAQCVARHPERADGTISTKGSRTNYNGFEHGVGHRKRCRGTSGATSLARRRSTRSPGHYNRCDRQDVIERQLQPEDLETTTKDADPRHTTGSSVVTSPIATRQRRTKRRSDDQEEGQQARLHRLDPPEARFWRPRQGPAQDRQEVDDGSHAQADEHKLGEFALHDDAFASQGDPVAGCR